MNEIKSLDYLVDIIVTIGKKNAVDTIQNISYLLADNGHKDARYFMDELMEVLVDI